jgi:GNAT superfamily N-acetyltransferase
VTSPVSPNQEREPPTMAAGSSATHPRIRLGTEDDATELARLRWAFTEEQGYATGGDRESFATAFAGFLEDALSSGRWMVWVADAGDHLVGHVYLQVVSVVPRPGRQPKLRWGYVTTFFVDPRFRGAGVGTELMDALVEFAQTQELELLQVWPSERSVTLYRRAGFVTSPDAMELPLEK